MGDPIWLLRVLSISAYHTDHKKSMTVCFFVVNRVVRYDLNSHRGGALAASGLALRVAEVPPLGPCRVGPSLSGL